MAEGDARAFGMLVQRHTNRSFAIAFRLLGDRQTAEDVVQEAWLRSWRHAGRWRPGEAKFTTWLHRVVVNLSLDLARRNRRRRTLPIDAALDLASDDATVEERLIGSGRERALAAAVQKLPERQRAALVLTYAGGLSNAEVADALQISIKAVESLLVRARRELRGRLIADGA